eukprot:TRINITY_DN8678_c1_g4_i1.p1 TRINITY_DN8678_c1_g4~~TRINITY_DN8678_c1_g4_i1.p1  ORF type:complete len:393 (-),score=53.26 TRINITY_DN8678_c1_g4_i1:145-1323(-)
MSWAAATATATASPPTPVAMASLAARTRSVAASSSSRSALQVRRPQHFPLGLSLVEGNANTQSCRGLAGVGLLGFMSLGTAGILGRRRGTARFASNFAGSSIRKKGRYNVKVKEPPVIGAPDGVMGAPQTISSRGASSRVDSWTSLAHIYCVNLDHRPERWSFMQAQFQRMQMPVERFSAVKGKDLDVPQLADIGLVAMEALPRYFLPDEQKLFGTDLTDGGIGCALSHMLIWREIVLRCAAGAAHPREPFLVIEDDCEFAQGFSEEALAQRMAHVPDDWELVYLGGQDLLRRQHNYQVGSGVRRLYKGFRETTAYLINGEGAKTCLEVCTPMWWQVDTHLNDESLREGLSRPNGGGETDYTMRPRGYCLWPPMVAQQREGFPTDVQTVEHN